MSEFYARVIANDALREKLVAILAGKDVTQATDEELTKIGEIAKAEGFSITLAEARAYIASDAKDLSDEALETVAGGTNKGKTICTGEGAGTIQVIQYK